MLTKLYIDNYRCFEDFTLELGPMNLFIGRNGTGKSTIPDLLTRIRQFATEGALLKDAIPASSLTRWQDNPLQCFRLDVSLEGARYEYTLQVQHDVAESKSLAKSEYLLCDGKTLLVSDSGVVQRLLDGETDYTQYELDPIRSVLPTIKQAAVGTKLFVFKNWLTNLHCAHVDPRRMQARSEREAARPLPDCSDYADWYRHLAQEDPTGTAALNAALRDSLAGFDSLVAREAGENVRMLKVLLRTPAGAATKAPESNMFELRFDELSDGQRTLIVLYTFLHLSASQGRTLIIDEPDNFVSLPEIQPWLLELLDRVDEGKGQAILISHHPELLNQMAADCGIVFSRDGAGPVRVKPYKASGTGAITAAEDVARGWFDE